MNFHEIRNRADQVRNIPLESILLAVGAQPDRYDKAKWHTAKGVVSVTGAKFMNWEESKGGGGAIDLAMHLKNIKFTDAVEWLRTLSPDSLPLEPLPSKEKPILQLPRKNAANTSEVYRYLKRVRGLNPSLFEPLIESGLIYADKHVNAVFLLLGKKKIAVGAELRGTGQRTWKGMAPGSNKNAGYFSVKPDRVHRIILCESAIDALSCLSLIADSWCISTSGARSNPPWLPQLFQQKYPLYCGFDADETGEKAAREMISLYPKVKRCRPPRHDWNAVITTGM